MMEESMKNESTCKKLCIAIGSAVHLAFAAIVGIIFAVWWANSNSMQNLISFFGEDHQDVNVYDALPGIYFLIEEGRIENGTSTYEYYSEDNWSDAMSYWIDIEKDCGQDFAECA